MELIHCATVAAAVRRAGTPVRGVGVFALHKLEEVRIVLFARRLKVSSTMGESGDRTVLGGSALCCALNACQC